MAFIHFDSSYAPCGFLIVKTDGDPYEEEDSVLVDVDWDFPAIATRMGFFISSDHEFCREDGCSTDGTVVCPVCGKTPSEFISEAYDFIVDHEGEEFTELDDYFYER